MRTYARKLRWRRLAPGVLTLLILSGTMLFVMMRVGVGALPGPRFRIYAQADQARGILRGSDVWLAGKTIGRIEDISYLSAAGGTQTRVLLHVDILEEYHHLIRGDSRAQVRAGARLIANPVLHISPGTLPFEIVSAGDTIGTEAQFDYERLIARAEEAILVLPGLFSDASNLFGDAGEVATRLISTLQTSESRGAPGSLRALITAIALMTERVQASADFLFLSDTSLTSRLSLLAANTDSLLNTMSLAGSPLAQGISSQAFTAESDSVAKAFAQLLQLTEQRVSEITTGARAAALAGALEKLTESLRTLRADARRRPFRYIVF